MSKLIKIDKDYAKWIQGLSLRFRNMQIKAATKVNQEMLMFYWSLGKDIVEMKSENKWGSGFLKNLKSRFKRCVAWSKQFFAYKSWLHETVLLTVFFNLPPSWGQK